MRFFCVLTLAGLSLFIVIRIISYALVPSLHASSVTSVTIDGRGGFFSYTKDDIVRREVRLSVVEPEAITAVLFLLENSIDRLGIGDTFNLRAFGIIDKSSNYFKIEVNYKSGDEDLIEVYSDMYNRSRIVLNGKSVFHGGSDVSVYLDHFCDINSPRFGNEKAEMGGIASGE